MSEPHQILRGTMALTSTYKDIIQAALSNQTQEIGKPILALGPQNFSSAFEIVAKTALKPVDEVEWKTGKGHLSTIWAVLHPSGYEQVKNLCQNILNTDDYLDIFSSEEYTGASLWGYELITTKNIKSSMIWVIGKTANGWVKQTLKLIP